MHRENNRICHLIISRTNVRLVTHRARQLQTQLCAKGVSTSYTLADRIHPSLRITVTYTNARKNVHERKQLSARRLDACWTSVVSSIRFLVNFSFHLKESCASAVTVQSKKQYPASIEPLIMPSFVSSRWMSCRRMRMKYFHFHDWTDDEELAAAACTAATDGDSWFPACSMRNGSKDREKPDMPLKRQREERKGDRKGGKEGETLAVAGWEVAAC